jgi:MFS family permease
VARGPLSALGRFGAGFPALRHRNFRRYILGQGISLVGFWMQSVAQGWLVYRISGSALALGAVSAASYLPVLCLAPVAGVIADRVPKLRLILVTQTLSMLLALTLGGLVAAHLVTVPIVAAFAMGLGVVGAFDLPTRQAFLVEMVGPEDLPSAIAMNASIFNTARVVGPAIAGSLVGIAGEAPCFLLNGASYVAVLWALTTLDLPAAATAVGAGPRPGFLSGLEYVRNEPVLRALLLALGAVSGLALQFNALLPAAAQRMFGAGATGYGLLLTAFGTGAVLSALGLASSRYTREQHVRNLLLGLCLFGTGLLALGTTHRLGAALACEVLAGFGMIRFTATTNAMLQLLVDDRYRGRIMGLHTVMFLGTAPAGSLILGAVAERRSVPAALVVAGTVPLVTAAWLARRLVAARGRE